MVPAAWAARFIRSDRPITDTMAVALIITSQLLLKPGSAWRSICGPTMRHSTCQGVKPQATAASRWPAGTARKAPRSTSVK